MKIIYYVVVGMPLLACILFALAEIITPDAFIRWRQRVTAADTGTKASMRDWFDARLGTGGSEPWTDPAAIRRVRLFGVGLLVVSVIWGYIFLVLLPRTI